MAVEIISRSISMKVWDRAGIKLATPGAAVRSDMLQTVLLGPAILDFQSVANVLKL